MTRRNSLPFAFRALLLLALCALPSAFAHAQGTTATLSGRVMDQNGAVVPGADVTIINTGTGLQRQAQTNDDGYFTVPLLPPSTYTVRAQHAGFSPIEIPNVVLNIGDRKSLQINLKAGDIKEAVTVQSDAVTLNTTDGSVSTVIDQKYVANMPLNGRSFQSLILLTPGTVTQSPQLNGATGSGHGESGEFSVNGQRTESNYYTVDGVSANVGAAAGRGMIFGAGP